MGAAIASMLGLAAGVAVSPLPIVAMILLLATPRGRVNGVAFALGWVVGLAVLGGLVLALSGSSGTTDDGEPAAWSGWAKVALALLLIAFAVRQVSRRDAAAGPPKWMASMDKLNPTKSFGLGAALSSVSPKNLPLAIAAGLAIAGTGESGLEQAIALALFIVIATLGVGAPLAISLFAGERSAPILERLREWFVAHNPAIMAVLFFVIGLKLLGDGMSIVT